VISVSARRRPSRLPVDDPGRLAALRLLAGVGLADWAIGHHLGLTENSVWRLRRRHGIPSGRMARERAGLTPLPKGVRFDLEDTGEL